jgi:hypothetical protein
MHEAILKECGKNRRITALERIQIGRRLLSVSRECIRRRLLSFLCLSDDGRRKIFSASGKRKCLPFAAFSDWKSVALSGRAEMTMGMAIGYDWLNDILSEESKQLIRVAIFKKGLEPSF